MLKSTKVQHSYFSKSPARKQHSSNPQLICTLVFFFILFFVMETEVLVVFDFHCEKIVCAKLLLRCDGHARKLSMKSTQKRNCLLEKSSGSVM